ncbi:hypothetical protein HA150_00375 [Prochlorococcus marinus XMU1414]|uniref:Uncharacterized protein n=1 Tax=Prochlorococcus marinus XMU1424 TaxID=2774497 RepID=A0A9D9C0Z5_PROMR|nr:hypothetical protein [Prochlorococcus marinus]MBO8227352.1 hypothetical protein [Prochlorococcus marinus XMU1414]MBW3044867.1 hypothetical protein [Prochlorococcus marinus str. MU1414]MCR8532870.1 hypothetical protein [Prochlorococcus marinus XMU1420]MCR8536598.1 hypothetical protein [Prochlorococcus marinus XMU1424]
MTKKPNKYSHKAESEIRVNGQTFRTAQLYIYEGLDLKRHEKPQFTPKDQNKIIRRKVKEFEDAKGNYNEHQLFELNVLKNDGRKLSKRNISEDNALRAALIAKGII